MKTTRQPKYIIVKEAVIRKNILSIFVCALLLLIVVSPAHSANGLYVGANLGLALARDADVQDSSPKITFKADPGYALGAAVGYGFDYVRGEAEVSFQKNNLNKVGVAGIGEIGISGDVSNLAFLLNGYFDIKTGTALTPYISAGIGVDRVEISAINVPSYGALTSKSYSDTVFAYQVGAGVGFAVTEKVTIDLKYRYFGTSDPKFDVVKTTNSSNNIYLGVRYTF